MSVEIIAGKGKYTFRKAAGKYYLDVDQGSWEFCYGPNCHYGGVVEGIDAEIEELQEMIDWLKKQREIASTEK
jgi:hypothetical protein